MEEFKQQLEKFRQQDEEKLNWVQGFVEKYTEISQKFNDASIDLESERSFKRELHKETTHWRKKYEDVQRCVDRSSFIVVLIDADTDGYVFDEKYLLRGTQGGHQAAHDLKLELQQYFEKESPTISGVPYMIKLYANIEKLKATMLRSGMNEAAGQLRDFSRGFSQVGGLVDFIDVGDGREQADHQIKGVLEHFKENPSCKHIVLGGCHDNGYVRNLNVIVPDERICDRITLLKSFQTGSEYDSLPFKSTRFHSVFRDRPFSAPRQSPIIEDAAKHASENGTTEISPNKSYAKMANSTPSSSSTPSAWNPFDLSGLVVSGQIIVNALGQRIDSILAQPPSAARDSLNGKKQVLGKNPCNLHHLCNRCPMPPRCSFFHESLSEAETLVLRNDLRRQPCNNGLACQDPWCIYGHNCKCTNSACKFRKGMHHVDMRGMRKVQCG